jgi:integrase
MDKCKYCEYEITKRNIPRHLLRKCVVKILFNKTKAEIDELISKADNFAGENIRLHEKCKEYHEMIKSSDIKIGELLKDITELTELVKTFSTTDNIDNLLQSKEFSRLLNIQLFNIKDSTKELYSQTWEIYNTECINSGICPFLKSSADAYLTKELNRNQSNTVQTKKKIIQSILRKTTGKDIVLENYQTNQRIRKATFLDEDEITTSLADIKEENTDLYMKAYLQYNLGLRINAISNLEVKHLKFLDSPNSMKMTIPDQKTGEYDAEVSDEIINSLKEYLDSNNIKEGYIFERNQLSKQPRHVLLRKKMNRDLKNITHQGSKTITSHDLRRSYCENKKSFYVERYVIDKVAKHINANMETTRKHYLQPFQHNSIGVTQTKLFSEWNKYTTWCEDKDKPVLEEETCNKYIKDSVPEEKKTSLIKSLLITINKKKTQMMEDNEEIEYGKECPRCMELYSDNYVVCPKCKDEINNVAESISQRYFNLCRTFIIEQIPGAKFKIPETTNEQLNVLQISLARALITKNMIFNDNLLFTPDAKFFSDKSTERIGRLPEPDLLSFKKFKEYSQFCYYPPVEILWDKRQGFYVQATGIIPEHTIVAEYIGNVYTDAKYLNSSTDDSLMEYTIGREHIYNTVISPEKVGNIARYISGINNTKKNSGNIASLKFRDEEGIRIMLFAIKEVNIGEELNYDYNAGGRLNGMDTTYYH